MITVSTTLLNPTEKLKIQLSVGFNNNEYKNLISIYENNKGVYVSINPNIVVIMKYVIPNKEWERSDTVYINERNIYALNNGLKHFYQRLLRKDLFIYNTKGYAVEIHSKEGDTETIPLTKGQVIQLEPAIIYDKQGNPLPGVMLHLNKLANEIDLSIDEYEAMMNMFQHIRIRQEGMTILQLYMSMRKKPMEVELRGAGKQSNKDNAMFHKKSIFDRKTNNQNTEFVKSPMELKNPKDIFMNLPENIEES